MPSLGVHRADTTGPVDDAAPLRRATATARRPAPVAGSVVIPAHDEATRIGRGLERLFDSLGPGIEVVVVCNGCTDDTARVARDTGLPVTVVELAVASKARALRIADRVATAFPRVYLDADVLVTGRSIRAVLRHLGEPGAVAARPPLAYDTADSSWVVRRFFRARARLPHVMGSLWGAGVYALSATGRSRYGELPLVLADDLFVDRLFRMDEIDVVETEPVVVTAPVTVGGLLASFRRAFRGNRAVDPTWAGDRAGTRDTVRDLVGLARQGPSELVDALVYAGVVIAARGLARTRSRSSDHWERDETTRR